jgi:stress response protein YsnF
MPKGSRSAPDAVSVTDSRVIPIVEEQAVIHMRKTLAEGVRVQTVVHEGDAVIDEPIVIDH